jgi:peptidyl-prolyl cis-trans isomerase C
LQTAPAAGAHRPLEARSLMPRLVRLLAPACVLAASAAVAHAQAPPASPVAAAKPAAVVNGRVIPESDVEQALRPIAKDGRAQARTEILNLLIEKTLIDHYLELLKVTVDPKEVETQIATFKKEVTDAKQDFAKVLEKMDMTEAELKSEIFNQLRWEKFVTQQASDEKLKKLFDASPEIFDGSTVKARHILIPPTTPDEAGKAAALAKIKEIKAGIEKAVAVAVADIPADADALTKQKQAQKAMETAFAATAKDKSTCKSKQDGGLLGEFPRMGMMVEPFARAAFAQKPFEIGEPVLSQFGYHLILVTAHNAGQKPDFEKVKGAVTEVYAGKLREAIVEKMKADPNTKIEIK